MNWNSYIKKLKGDNPSIFAAKKIQISTGSLESLLKKAHDAGFNHGFKFEREHGGKNKPFPSNPGDFLKEIFGRK